MRSATYMDRFLAGVALALGQAQLGKRRDTLEALEAVEAAIEATDDAAAPVLVQVARAEALRALGDGAGVTAAQEEATRRAELLDLDPAPWQLAFRLAAGGDVDTPAADGLS